MNYYKLVSVPDEGICITFSTQPDTYDEDGTELAEKFNADFPNIGVEYDLMENLFSLSVGLGEDEIKDIIATNPEWKEMTI